MTNPGRYELIEFYTGHSHGPFRTVRSARRYARVQGLPSWYVRDGHKIVARHKTT